MSAPVVTITLEIVQKYVDLIGTIRPGLVTTHQSSDGRGPRLQSSFVSQDPRRAGGLPALVMIDVGAESEMLAQHAESIRAACGNIAIFCTTGTIRFSLTQETAE